MHHDPIKIEAELCRRSFYYFVQSFWGTIIAEAPVWNWHIKYLCDEMQDIGKRSFLIWRGRYNGETGEKVLERLEALYDYVIINVPPGSTKSTIASEMYPLWCWINDATQRFICGSYAATPAEDIAEKCYKIFYSDKFKSYFPHLHNKNTKGGKTHFHNGLLGERFTTSTGSAVTGMHAHQILIDDPMNPTIAASKTERETANRWIDQTLGTRKVDKKITLTWLIMQRLHELDSTGYLLKKKSLRIKHICIPNELSDDVRPVEIRKYYKDGMFDPTRSPRSLIPALKEQLGSYGYAGQMQQRPSPAEGGIIKKHWFGFIDRSGYKSTSRPVHFQLDTAYTEETKNDPTGVIAYYKEGGNIFIIGRAIVYMELPELFVWLQRWCLEMGYDHRSIIHVEPKASGKSIVQVIKAGTKLNIKESEAPKEDKLTRLYVIQPKIEAGRCILHRGTWNDDFIDEICSFPNAEHDEMVDCLSALVKRELITHEGGISVVSFSGAFG